MLSHRALLGLVAWAVTTAAFGQTIPPDPDPPRSKEPLHARAFLTKDETLQRITQARLLLRNGAVSDAVNKLQGEYYTVDLGKVPFRDQAHLARALIAFGAGDLRTAEREATQVHKISDMPSCLTEAYVLMALVYGQAGVEPLSEEMLLAARAIEPRVSVVKRMLELRAGRRLPSYTLERAPRSATYPPDFYFVFARGQGAAEKDLVVIVRQSGDKDEFRAALALESQALGGRTTYSISLYDLEGVPLRIAEGLERRPSDADFLAFVESFNPAFGPGRYTLLRSDLEALTALQLGITPLASRWADWGETKLVREKVTAPLQQQHGDHWVLREVQEFGPWNQSGYKMLGYFNEELRPFDRVQIARIQNLKKQGIRTPEWEKFKGPLEHYHLAVFTRQPTRYCGSYAVASDEPVPGERLYFLKRLVQGRAQVVATYATLPTFENALKDARANVEQGSIPPLSVSRKEAIRIEDRLNHSDERDAAFRKGYRKVYTVRMHAGNRYYLDLSSPDFDASLRVEDDQGKDFRDVEHALFVGYLDNLLKEEEKDRFRSRVLFTAPRDGIYRMVATTYRGDTGRFALIVEEVPER